MSNKTNDLYRSGPGFTSGSIGALTPGKSSLDVPDLKKYGEQKGFEAVPKGARKAAQPSAGKAHADKAGDCKMDSDKRPKAADAGHQEGPLSRALHALHPRKRP